MRRRMVPIVVRMVRMRRVVMTVRMVGMVMMQRMVRMVMMRRMVMIRRVVRMLSIQGAMVSKLVAEVEVAGRRLLRPLMEDDLWPRSL